MQMQFVEESSLEQPSLNVSAYLSAYPNEHKDLVELLKSDVPADEVVVGRTFFFFVLCELSDYFCFKDNERGRLWYTQNYLFFHAPRSNRTPIKVLEEED